MSDVRGDPPAPASDLLGGSSTPENRRPPRRYTLIGRDRCPYPSDRPGTPGGHRGDRIYGTLDCPSALRAIARGGYVTERVFFADEATAIAAGYRPCATCCPERYQAWKASRESWRVLDAPSTGRTWMHIGSTLAPILRPSRRGGHVNMEFH